MAKETSLNLSSEEKLVMFPASRNFESPSSYIGGDMGSKSKHNRESFFGPNCQTGIETSKSPSTLVQLKRRTKRLEDLSKRIDFLVSEIESYAPVKRGSSK